jgi:hypothetical protein
MNMVKPPWEMYKIEKKIEDFQTPKAHSQRAKEWEEKVKKELAEADKKNAI